MTTETQAETTTQAPLSSELKKTAELLAPKHAAAELLAPAKRKAKVKAKSKAKRVASAKAKAKAKTVKAKSKAKAKAKTKRKPVTGQSAPAIDSLPFDDLNKKEKLVVGCFELKGEREVRTIEQLAGEAFKSQTLKRANSWVRNSLRRLIRANWLEKVTPGEYRLTESGRKRLVRADS